MEYGDNEITDQQVTALIDWLFQLLNESGEGTRCRRFTLPSGDAIEFAVNSRTGLSFHVFELDRMARLFLQDYPLRVNPEHALMALSAFVNRLIRVTRLGIDNANDISTLEVIELLHPMSASMREKRNNGDDAFKARQKKLLKGIEARNKLMLRRHPKNPLLATSLPRLVGALAFLRDKMPNEEVTVSNIALHLGLEDDAIYRSISRHGFTTREFFDAVSSEWREELLDKIDRVLSKNNSGDELG